LGSFVLLVKKKLSASLVGVQPDNLPCAKSAAGSEAVPRNILIDSRESTIVSLVNGTVGSRQISQIKEVDGEL
jgi:hypothetical protein